MQITSESRQAPALSAQIKGSLSGVANFGGARVSRRTVLKAGAVTALAPLAMNRRVPRQTQLSHVFSLMGEWSPTGAYISSMIRSDSPVDMAVSTSPAMGNFDLVGRQFPGPDHMVRHDLRGLLAPGRRYFARPYVNGDLCGRQLSFRTAAGDDTAETLKIALVSCEHNADLAHPEQPGWRRLSTYAPDLVLHMGDFGYWGGQLADTDPYTRHLDFYGKAMTSLPIMRGLLEASSSLIEVSDHETSGNNGDNYNDPVTAAALTAYFHMMPWASFDDSTRRSRFLTRRLGPNVRLIAPDFRSLDRAPASWPDDDRKSAYGAHQFDLLVAALKQPEALKIILSDPGCAPADADRENPKCRDKWSNYQTAYQQMVDVIRNERTIDGKPILVDMWSGDRHMIGYTLEADNRWGPFDVIVSSSIDQDANALEIGETYTSVHGHLTSKHQKNLLHVEVELTDDKRGTITRTARGVDSGTTAREVWRTTRRWSYDHHR